MAKYLLFAFGVLLSTACFSQKIQLINSGEVIEAGKISYDSGNYERAIKKYLTISERDTNYQTMQAELALCYLATKEYDKVLEMCDKALKVPSENRSHLLRSKAIALDKKGEYEKSIALFEKTIGEYPFDFVLIYNLGVTLINTKEYEKAKDCFFRALSINPFHSGSHLALSRISILQGRKVHGMLPMGIYLSINPSDNERLVLINNVVTNQVTDEGSITPTGVNSFEKLDQIVRAKMAMDKNFKSQFSFDFAIVKQFEMVMEQLATSTVLPDDRIANYYGSFYKLIKEKNLIEPFIYNLLTSTQNEQVKKWNKKNEKTLKAFFEAASAELLTKRASPYIPESLGIEKGMTAWYNDDRKLAALGRKTPDGKRIGKWLYYHPNGERSAEGSFEKDDNKTGIWKYFSGTGIISKVENYANGEMTLYHTDGVKHQHFFTKNDLIEGEAEIFYPCGLIQKKFNYKQDQRDGAATTYFPDGKLESKFAYKAGKLDGEYVNYYANGKVLNKLNYKDDKAAGTFTGYFPNGKISKTGNYVNDELEGEWKYYFQNGVLNRSGNYKKGIGVGEWKFYDQRGELVETRNLNQEGKLDGEDSYYKDGKLYLVETYKNDVLVKVVYLDKKGTPIGSFGKSDGTFPLKTFYATGQLNSEGALRKGKNHGKWKFYYRHGGLKSEFNYEDGLLQGPSVEYYSTGAKKSVAHYKDDQLHGYYQYFYVDGTVMNEGWYQNDVKQQQWLSYHMDGSLESDDYYLNDVLVKESLDYTQDGKVYVKSQYNDEGKLIDLRHYGPKGEVKTVVKEEGGKRVFETRFGNSKPQSRFEFLCNEYHGQVSRWYPDGKIYFTYPIINGNREGKYQYFDINNKLEYEGNYLQGTSEGVWTGYENGKLDFTGKYLNGDLDSTWIYYYPNGKISSSSNYIKGKRQGLTQYFNAESGPAVEKLYESGDLISYRVMKASGAWSDWTDFNGNAVITAYYGNGAKSYEEDYKNGMINSYKRLYFPDGKIFSDYAYKDGDYFGPFVSYYANGKIKQKGNYHYDELHGKIEWYNEDGTLSKSENYIMGIRTGKATGYSKGVKTKELTFWGANAYE
jgi:uncharacterized protein